MLLYVASIPMVNTVATTPPVCAPCWAPNLPSRTGPQVMIPAALAISRTWQSICAAREAEGACPPDCNKRHEHKPDPLWMMASSSTRMASTILLIARYPFYTQMSEYSFEDTASVRQGTS
jgi:hypothetical protein